MPGQRINQVQIGVYMKQRKEGKSQITSAAKAGFSERSARNIEQRGFQPAQTQHNWPTRKDPFEAVWNKELVPMLEAQPRLQAKTLLEHLQRQYVGQFPDKLLRTLQRRVKKWRALHGPDKEVIFRQNHPPGWQGLSDFTATQKLKITIAGEPLNHLLYHYRLAYSGWEYAEVVLGGESFTALTENIQNALWQCGGAPRTHRTDSLSAAFKNLSRKTHTDLTKGYEEFCTHYGMEPTRNNRGVSHENGTIESAHRHLKSRIDQALMIRGSRDFTSLNDYRQLVRELISTHNRRIQKEYLEELAYLNPLPKRKATDYTEERVRVTNSSTILLKGVLYSVPAKLVAETIKVHLYDDRLECFVGGCHVVDLPRKHKNRRHERQINYKHLVEAMIKKPTSFKNYIYKEAFFPTLAFKQTWELLKSHHDSYRACKEYLTILREAAKGENESVVNDFLELCLTEQRKVTAKEVQALFSHKSKELPSREVACDTLASYEILMTGGVS